MVNGLSLLFQLCAAAIFLKLPWQHLVALQHQIRAGHSGVWIVRQLLCHDGCEHRGPLLGGRFVDVVEEVAWRVCDGCEAGVAVFLLERRFIALISYCCFLKWTNFDVKSYVQYFTGPLTWNFRDDGSTKAPS